MQYSPTGTTEAAHQEIGKAAMHCQSRMLALPQELKEEIVSYLDTATAKNLARTCTILTEPAERNSWRSINLGLSDADLVKESSLESCVLSVKITKVWTNFLAALESRPIRTRTIQSIKYPMNQASQTLAAAILPRLSRLEDITDYMSSTEHDHDSPMLSSQYPGPSLVPLIACGEMLSVRTLDVCTAVGTSDQFFRALRNFPNLVQLCTQLTNTQSGELISSQAPEMPKLTSLTFNVTVLPDVAIDLVAKAPQLRSLTFNQCTAPTGGDSALVSQICQSRTICTLDPGLYTWDYITNSGSLGMDCLPSLEKLTLTTYVSVTYKIK